MNLYICTPKLFLS